MEPSVLRCAADHIEALIGVGELGEAHDRLRRLEAWGRAHDRPWARATGARCRGLLEAVSGDPERALASLDRALHHHPRLPVPFELGRTWLVRGEILRRLRQKSGAKASLERSVAIFEGLGATLWIDRARGALRRVGVRPPSPRDLTETERRVADLAASGRTNREIAQALFVSPKTVEANVARVYRKLGIRSRVELVSALANRAPSR
jgi:DNA-binding CsgD family transcriptional regulator